MWASEKRREARELKGGRFWEKFIPSVRIKKESGFEFSLVCDKGWGGGFGREEKQRY